MVSDFQQRKKSILSKQDKSSKGKWDEKIAGLCEKINSSENYYTTSSCSGRVVLIVDVGKKQEDLFLKVYHSSLSFKEFKKDLNKIASLCSDIDGSEPDIHQGSPLKINYDIVVSQRRNLTKSISKSLNRTNRASEQKLSSASARGDYLIKFKQEPPILHIACEDLESAQKLHDKAKLAGWKRSGIIASGKRFILELNSTEKLEFPIVKEGKILVGDEFLKIVVAQANENLKKGWDKISKLKRSI